MGQIVLTNVKVQINSVDLSNHVESVTIEETFADVDTTAFGQTAKTRIAGLGDHKVTINFQQDWATSSVEATVGALVGATTQVFCIPVNGAINTQNPSYSFVVLVTDWKPIDGKVGDLATSSVTWPVSGSVTKSNT